jgi:hypothetical protein
MVRASWPCSVVPHVGGSAQVNTNAEANASPGWKAPSSGLTVTRYLMPTGGHQVWR